MLVSATILRRSCLVLFFAAAHAAAQTAGVAETEGAQVPLEADDVTIEGALSESDVPVAEEGVSPADTAPDLFLQQVNEELDGGGLTETTLEPSRTESSSPKFLYVLRVVSALCIVLFLVIFAGYIARRVARRSPLLAGGDLGTVLGRLYLAKGSVLHFVETGGRVLVVGVANDKMSLIAEFNAEEFGVQSKEEAENFDPESFVAHLRESEEELQLRETLPRDEMEDQEIASLRGDIKRLRGFLRQESGDSGD